MAFQLNNDNYYSEQANTDYMSVSQFKDFAGSLMHYACEATALKKFQNLIPLTMTKALLVGSYVDSFYEGTLNEFKQQYLEDLHTKTSIKAFTKSQNPADLQLLADFKQAENIIQKTTNDELFSEYMSGQKQVIMTGNLFGIDWKIKMDSYHPDDKIVDLKVMRSMDPIWSDRNHMKSDFIRYWGYDIQGAVYQKIVEINTGKKLPFFIACATKEDMTDIEIIEIEQSYLDAALEFVKQNLQHVLDIKSGKIAPVACGTCYWCKQAKKLDAPIKMSAIIPHSDFETEESDTIVANDDADSSNTDIIASEYGQAPATAFHLFG